MKSDMNRYAILGINRVSKDFLYLFDQLDVKFFMYPPYEKVMENVWGDIPIISLDEGIKRRDEFDKIILCGFDKKKEIKEMEKRGAEYKQDYVLEEDFFSLLNDEPINVNGRKVAIWGTGKIASRFVDNNPSCNISYYIDAYSSMKTFRGKPVRRPNEILNRILFFIIVAVKRNTTIHDELEKNGFRYGEDYVDVEDYPKVLENLAREIIFQKYEYGIKCRTMLNHLEIGRNDTSCCCTTFLDYRLKGILNHEIQDVWKSNLHKILCLSTENHTYIACKKDMCPFFIGQLPQQNEFSVNSPPYQKMQDYPTVVSVGFDSSCNLYCETCRNEIMIAQGQEKEKIRLMAEKVRTDYLPHANFFIMAGDGEALLSPAYRLIYESEEAKIPRYIRLLSNGMLFNEKTWSDFQEDKTAKIILTCSVDAATKETYEMIRRGGNFDVLKNNMEFASRLRQEGKLSYFRMNFVVQRRNFMEMEQFVKWGIKLHADEIFFTKILNWGTFTKEEFNSVSMMEEDGITPKKELQDVLNHPIMSEKIVDLGTIRFSQKKVIDADIYNYYEWELERKVPNLFDK